MQRTCVYSDKSHHKSIECSSVTKNPVSEDRFYGVNDSVLTVLVQGTESRSVTAVQNIESVMESTISQL